MLLIIILLSSHIPVLAFDLQPGVAELIRGTFMERPAGYPDPNEPIEVIRPYLDKADLETFQRLVQIYPDCRHAHLGYAQRAQEKYQQTKDRQWLHITLREVLAAAKIGLRYGRVDYAQWIKRLALQTNQPQMASQWFEQVLREIPDHYETTLQYAKLLQETNSPQAENMFLKAIEVRPEGTFDALTCYAEFLLDQGRYEDALPYTVAPDNFTYYLDFLHGFALEMTGRGAEAVVYYQKFVRFSHSFPAPSRYRIPGSPFQKGVAFDK